MPPTAMKAQTQTTAPQKAQGPIRPQTGVGNGPQAEVGLGSQTGVGNGPQAQEEIRPGTSAGNDPQPEGEIRPQTDTGNDPQARVKTIPPDMAAVLSGAPIHPDLLRTPFRPVTPTVATLTSTALVLASYAARQLGELDATESDGVGLTGTDFARADLAGAGLADAGLLRDVVLHTIGSGGVLHLEATTRPRAVSLALGALAQRCTSRPGLRPGTVRLLPAGCSATLADLEGSGALVIEVVY